MALPKLITTGCSQLKMVFVQSVVGTSDIAVFLLTITIKLVVFVGYFVVAAITALVSSLAHRKG